MALLVYGAGLRVMECLQLRVQDVGFDIGNLRFDHRFAGFFNAPPS